MIPQTLPLRGLGVTLRGGLSGLPAAVLRYTRVRLLPICQTRTAMILVAYTSDTAGDEGGKGGQTVAGPARLRAQVDAARHETQADAVIPETEDAPSPLQMLPPGPARSLGGYLDYSGWPERERFLELDRAIARQAEEQRGSDDEARSVNAHRGTTSFCEALAREDISHIARTLQDRPEKRYVEHGHGEGIRRVGAR